MPVEALSAIVFKAVLSSVLFLEQQAPRPKPAWHTGHGPTAAGHGGQAGGGCSGPRATQPFRIFVQQKIICTFISNFILIKLKICCRVAGSATWAGQPPGSRAPASIPVPYCPVHSMKSQSKCFCAEMLCRAETGMGALFRMCDYHAK